MGRPLPSRSRWAAGRDPYEAVKRRNRVMRFGGRSGWHFGCGNALLDPLGASSIGVQPGTGGKRHLARVPAESRAPS